MKNGIPSVQLDEVLEIQAFYELLRGEAKQFWIKHYYLQFKQFRQHAICWS